MSGIDTAHTKDASDSDDTSVVDFASKAYDEVTKHLQQHGQETAKTNSAVPADGVKHFGKVTLSDHAAAATDTKAAQPGKAGDAPSHGETTSDATAAHLQARAEYEIRDAHKPVKYTISGNPPKVVDYTEDYPLAFPQPAQLTAMLALGPDADPKQLNAYAKAIEALNKDKLTDDGHGHKYFAMGSHIKLPGQTAEGGITWRKDGHTMTAWTDGAMLTREGNAGSASYKHDGKDVAVTWNHYKPEQNTWTSEKAVGDGAARHKERTETTFDEQGRSIEKVYGEKAGTPESIKITDRTRTTIDLKPGADGEFHGQKTYNGKVLDADMGMTADNRIYSRRTDAEGNTVKVFDHSSETYNPKGELIARTSTDKNRSVNSIYKDGHLESVKITNTDKSVAELVPGKHNEMVGARKDAHGNVIDQVGMKVRPGQDPAEARLYSRAETASGVTRTYENGDITKTDKNGKVVETTTKDEQGRTIVESYKNGEETSLTLKEKDGSTISLAPGADGDYHGVKKDAAGHIVDKHVGMDTDWHSYSEKTEAGIRSRTFSDGTSDKHDQHNNLIERSDKDAAGRQRVMHYDAGADKPSQIDLKITPADKPLDFKRNADGTYEHQEKSNTGELLRTIQYDNDSGALTYKNAKNGSKWTVGADGSAQSEATLASGNIQRVQQKNGEMVSTEVHKDPDGKEHQVNQIFMDRHGDVFEYKYKDDVVDTITLHKPDGFVELKRTDNGYAGKFTNWVGHQEDAKIVPGQGIVYIDKSDGTSHRDKIDWEAGHIAPTLTPTAYDTNTATVTEGSKDKALVVESVSPGRLDTVLPDGTVSGMTITGEISYQKPTGDAAVVHPNLEGGRITADGKVETWKDGATVQDSLTGGERVFLMFNPEVDRRDLLEIHRRYQGDTAKLDGIYTQLMRVGSAEHLSDVQKDGVVKSLMHHIAHPAEIYQGSSPTCNVTVLQRDLAVNEPDKYAKFVMDAIVDGKVRSAQPQDVPMDVQNLTMEDFSGRDIASRIFQTAALNVYNYPNASFENTEDGVGRFHHLDHSPDEVFGGLTVAEIAKLRWDLTGEAKAQISVHSPEELAAMFKQNGGGPMTIGVDAYTYPFGGSDVIGAKLGGHVVNIVGMEPGPPVRFKVQNQWGLGSDHSTIISEIDGEDLYYNMSNFGGGAGLVIANAPSASKTYQAKTGADGSVSVTD